jgi:hypothetical protein
LRGDAPEGERRQRVCDGIADLRGGMPPACFLKADLRGRIFHQLHHQHVA